MIIRRKGMEVLDLKGSLEFSPTHHVYKCLSETPHSSISIVGWEPGQISPIHSHPDADEIYYILDGEGLFNDGRKEMRLGPGATVVFPAGEVHQVKASSLPCEEHGPQKRRGVLELRGSNVG
jgi:quercetin dioxygenase-like cupin family protein